MDGCFDLGIAFLVRNYYLGNFESFRVGSLSRKLFSFESSPVENSELPEDDVKIKKQVKTADVTRTITTPDREEPENSEINTETV